MQIMTASVSMRRRASCENGGADPDGANPRRRQIPAREEEADEHDCRPDVGQHDTAKPMDRKPEPGGEQKYRRGQTKADQQTSRR
jgi:hypothetical protein